MLTDTLANISSAVTPAVMVSACGLLALGLDNQANRLSGRLRELATAHRGLSTSSRHRRDVLRRQIELFAHRHDLIVRALLLDYLALFAFVTTSFLALVSGTTPVPAQAPVMSFAAGVLMLLGLCAMVLLSLVRSREALALETDTLEGAEPERPTRGTPSRLS
jgi:hypothetical protein